MVYISIFLYFTRTGKGSSVHVSFVTLPFGLYIFHVCIFDSVLILPNKGSILIAAIPMINGSDLHDLDLCVQFEEEKTVRLPVVLTGFSFSNSSFLWERIFFLYLSISKSQHKSSNMFWWECSATIVDAPGCTPYNGLYGEAPPERGVGTFFRLEVYERLGKSVICVCERVQRAEQMNALSL